jgi:hypothetical protein
MTKHILSVESVRERDIDIILLEELTANENFVKWIIDKLKLPNYKKFYGAWKSISDFGLGETDILFSYSTANNLIVYVLIENKLDCL